MGARYPWYLLADSPEGQRKEAEIAQRRTVGGAHRRQHPSGLRLRARAAHHPEIHRQQCRDRRDLGALAGDPGAPARPPQRRPRQAWEEWEIPREAGEGWPTDATAAHADMVGGPHRPPEGDRRLHRRQGGPRVSLRQALCRQRAHPRCRPLHGREPGAAPDAGGGRERRALLRLRRPRSSATARPRISPR